MKHPRLYSLFVRRPQARNWMRATFSNGAPVGAYHIHNARRVFADTLLLSACGISTPYGPSEHRLRPLRK